MSAQPPPSDRPNAIPGYLVVLAAFSVLVLLFSIGIGLVAFGIVDPSGPDDSPPIPTVGVEGQALQASGFTILESREVDNRPEIDVNVSITNVSDERLTNTTILVQCLDNGNVSNSELIMGIDPDQTLQYEITLYGTGNPACTEPQISFDLD